MRNTLIILLLAVLIIGGSILGYSIASGHPTWSVVVAIPAVITTAFIANELIKRAHR